MPGTVCPCDGLSDTTAIATTCRNEGQSATAADVTRFLAQWAVNVVAYRDHNSIMIPFVYDLIRSAETAGTRPRYSAPTSPTHPAYGLGLQATRIADHETLAFHDRRTQDLSTETVNQNKLAFDSLPANPKRTPGLIDGSGKQQGPEFQFGLSPARVVVRRTFQPLDEYGAADDGPRFRPQFGHEPTTVAQWRSPAYEDDRGSRREIVARLEADHCRSVESAPGCLPASQRRRTSRPGQSHDWPPAGDRKGRLLRPFDQQSNQGRPGDVLSFRDQHVQPDDGRGAARRICGGRFRRCECCESDVHRLPEHWQPSTGSTASPKHGPLGHAKQGRPDRKRSPGGRARPT